MIKLIKLFDKINFFFVLFYNCIKIKWCVNRAITLIETGAQHAVGDDVTTVGSSTLLVGYDGQLHFA